MSLYRIHAAMMGGWILLVASMLALRIALGAGSPSLGESAAWFALSCGPAALLFFTVRGAPPPTIAEILYATDHPVLPAGDEVAPFDVTHAARR